MYSPDSINSSCNLDSFDLEKLTAPVFQIGRQEYPLDEAFSAKRIPKR